MIGGTLKVVFIGKEDLIVSFFSDIDVSNRSHLGILFKQVGLFLKNRYHYLLSGYYDAEIYENSNYFVFEIVKIHDSESIDFDISFHPDSPMLYEFEEEDYFLEPKYYYQGKYYVDFSLVAEKKDLLEYGEILYKDLDEIQRNWILVGKSIEN